MGLLVLDACACFGSTMAALELRFWGDVPQLHLLPYLLFAPLLIALRLFAAHCFGLYDLRHRLTVADHAFGAAGAAASSVVAGSVFLALVQLYYARQNHLSRLVAGLDACLLAGWFGVSRAMLLSRLHAAGYRIRVVLIGPVARCGALLEELRAHAPRLLELLGVVDVGNQGDEGMVEVPAGEDGRHEDAAEVLGRTADLAGVLEERRADQAILCASDLPQQDLRDVLLDCDRHGVELFLYPDLKLSVLTSARATSIAGLPLVSLSPLAGGAPYRFGKRLLDVVIAAGLLVVTSPAWVAAALAVKLTSRGPVLFVQERVGLHGRPFRILKFRTMVEGAEASGEAVLSTEDDPRVTGVGWWLRRFRIDEIPQLWNVLRGEMSMVGPRPERAAFIEEFRAENPLYERRMLVRPGLTGLAQIHGRYDTEYTQKLRYDLIYINGISLAADLRILLATVRTVMTGRGAI